MSTNGEPFLFILWRHFGLTAFYNNGHECRVVRLLAAYRCAVLRAQRRSDRGISSLGAVEQKGCDGHGGLVFAGPLCAVVGSVALLGFRLQLFASPRPPSARRTCRPSQA